MFDDSPFNLTFAIGTISCLLQLCYSKGSCDRSSENYFIQGTTTGFTSGIELREACNAFSDRILFLIRRRLNVQVGIGNVS